MDVTGPTKRERIARAMRLGRLGLIDARLAIAIADGEVTGDVIRDDRKRSTDATGRDPKRS